LEERVRDSLEFAVRLVDCQTHAGDANDIPTLMSIVYSLFTCLLIETTNEN
jgi:hypothetical protein